MSFGSTDKNLTRSVTLSQYAQAPSQSTTSTNPLGMSSDNPPTPPKPPYPRVLISQIPEGWITPLSGAGSGIASGLVTCPLDVIKTKLQAQGGFTPRSNGRMVPSQAVYSGMVGTAKTIWRDEGIKGMYRGLNPMLLGYLPTWAVYLTVYEDTQDFFEKRCSNWWVAKFCSSVTAGTCSTVLTNPIWVIKTRLMSQSNVKATDGFRAPWNYNSTTDAAIKMYRAEGFRAFYSGLTPALLGLTHVAIQFPLYEYFKMRFTGYAIGQHPEKGNSHWAGISLATFLSKTCASTATYPHEVIRTRLQTQTRLSRPAHSPEGIAYRGGDVHPSDMNRRPHISSSDGMMTKPRYDGVFKTVQVIWREEGWRAFYAGIGTNLVRAVPAAMTTMLTYEYLRRQLTRMRAEAINQSKAVPQP